MKIFKNSDRIYPAHPQVAVGAVVIHRNKVLLVHRRNPPSEGIWAIPGGKVRLGESLQEATEREILEETGVTIQAGEPVLTFDVIDRDETNRIRYHYVIVDLVGEYVQGEPTAGDDALSARWVSSEEMGTLPVSELTRQLLQDQFGF